MHMYETWLIMFSILLHFRTHVDLDECTSQNWGEKDLLVHLIIKEENMFMFWKSVEWVSLLVIWRCSWQKMWKVGFTKHAIYHHLNLWKYHTTKHVRVSPFKNMGGGLKVIRIDLIINAWVGGDAGVGGICLLTTHIVHQWQM